MSNRSQKILTAIPVSLLEQIDYAAQCEGRNRSDLVREALRRYLDDFRKKETRSFQQPAKPVDDDDDI